MGELAGILAGDDGGIPSRQSVTNAVGRAKALALIGHDSTVRCLTLPHHHFHVQRRREVGRAAPSGESVTAIAKALGISRATLVPAYR
ncbi:hypothetical protein BLA24_29475 [Streptomyces cinnamoneus]|uniref:Uncharacterized protein n=1 Tax=Streptomyces cinnamoneus TaxID=53446 RepID=A0A2G1XB96_STRCJ|nr:hypothetical protein BLA24_29475 [Streptomyces cinnamoneus]PPT12509.1 hypothetical protein CYQ11_06000 [Streptomyces cinnamoneus]